MRVVESLATLRGDIAQYRRRGVRIVFVPTMGNLHAGHLALVDEAQRCGERVVASIYVNPLQFAANEDLSRYPRTPDADRRELERHGVHLLFMPDDVTMYPVGLDQQTKVEVPELSDILCGAHRPGHFRGVTTVVSRLLNMVQPDTAVFGKKDYQQLVIIRRMVRDLAIPVKVVGVDIVRAKDGLALSSRNAYLDAGQRAVAPLLYQSLRRAQETIAARSMKFGEIERNSMQFLAEKGFEPEYFKICRRNDLSAPQTSDRELVILTAAKLGTTRLIDNLEVEI